MASPEDNPRLATEAAEALLTEIIRAAPKATDRGADYIRALADAYASVRESMPRKPGRVGTI